MRAMPRSTVTRCIGCYELIAIYHRKEADFPVGRLSTCVLTSHTKITPSRPGPWDTARLAEPESWASSTTSHGPQSWVPPSALNPLGRVARRSASRQNSADSGP
jgi:hypothetical protein